jgi:hypothetical protein
MDLPVPAPAQGGRHWLLIGTLACIAVAVGLEALRIPSVFTRDAVLLPDPDDWMRLWRAEQVASGKSLIIRNIEQVNPPTGMEMHWTAPVDYLVAVPGMIWRVISQRPHAFAEAAAWLPVALGAIYIAAMIAFLRRGHDPWTALLAGLFVAISPAFHRNFRLGHCDHHCLLELLYLLAVALWWPARSEPLIRAAGASPRSNGSNYSSRSRIILSGLCMGLALWVAPQSMAVWLAILVGLLFAARRIASEARGQWLTLAAWWQASILIVVWIGRLTERGYMSDQLAVDKIGPFQAALQTVALIGIVFIIRRHRKKSEGWAMSKPLAIWILIGVGITFLDLLPAVKSVDPMFSREFTRWSALVAELQPLYLHLNGQWSFTQLHEQLGLLPYALPILAIFFVKDRDLPCGAKLTLLLLAFGFTILSIFQRRWLDHVNLALAPVCVIGARVAASALARRRTARVPAEANSGGSSSSLKRHPILINVLASVLILALFIPTFAYSRATLSAGPDPYLLRTLNTTHKIIQYDNEHSTPTDAPNAILSEDGEGPMLLELTGHPVVATPYHRDLGGLIAAARFFAERDPAAAAELLHQHQVRYIVVPFRPHEQLMNFERMAFNDLHSFDPPDEFIDDRGRLRQKLHYKPEVIQTMAYRLAMFKGHGVPGIRLLAESPEGAPTPDGLSGLLYIVDTDGPNNPQSKRSSPAAADNPQLPDSGVKSAHP